jgi:hypothetical protein
MYKTITHNIKEEHYDHPAVLPKTLAVGDFFEPLPKVVINERTLVFRMDSRTHWTRYALGMINYSVSFLGKLDSTPAVERNLSRNAGMVGDYFIPYYGMTSGSKISSLLTVILINGTKVVQALDAKKDINAYNIIWEKQIYEFASYLNSLNPSQYPKDLIIEMFVNLTKFWVEDFIARIEGDFASDSIALDNILKVAVIGIPNHVNRGYSSIADIMSRGIIAQFPTLFAD